MLRYCLIFLIALYSLNAYSQDSTRTTFSGYGLIGVVNGTAVTNGGDHQLKMTFNDNQGVYSANDVAIGDYIWDTKCDRYMIVFINSTSPFLDVEVVEQNIGSGPPATGGGNAAVYRPTPTFNYPIAVQSINETVRACIVMHQILKLDQDIANAVIGMGVDSLAYIEGDSILVLYSGGIEVSRDTSDVLLEVVNSIYTDIGFNGDGTIGNVLQNNWNFPIAQNAVGVNTYATVYSLESNLTIGLPTAVSNGVDHGDLRFFSNTSIAGNLTLRTTLPYTVGTVDTLLTIIPGASYILHLDTLAKDWRIVSSSITSAYTNTTSLQADSIFLADVDDNFITDNAEFAIADLFLRIISMTNALGIPDYSTAFGTFTGTLYPDNNTGKQLFQITETELKRLADSIPVLRSLVESLPPSNSLYVGDGTIPDGTVATIPSYGAFNIQSDVARIQIDGDFVEVSVGIPTDRWGWQTAPSTMIIGDISEQGSRVELTDTKLSLLAPLIEIAGRGGNIGALIDSTGISLPDILSAGVLGTDATGKIIPGTVSGVVETIVAGTGISVNSADPANPIVTNTGVITEVDGDITNEGILGVGAGSATSATITTNTSGSNPVSLEVGTGLSISEVAGTNGGIITLANTGVLATTLTDSMAVVRDSIAAVRADVGAGTGDNLGDHTTTKQLTVTKISNQNGLRVLGTLVLPNVGASNPVNRPGGSAFPVDVLYTGTLVYSTTDLAPYWWNGTNWRAAVAQSGTPVTGRIPRYTSDGSIEPSLLDQAANGNSSTLSMTSGLVNSFLYEPGFTSPTLSIAAHSATGTSTYNYRRGLGSGGSPTDLVAATYGIGTINFQARQSSSWRTRLAMEVIDVDAGTDVLADLVFKTSSTNAANPVETMRYTNYGRLIIGGTQGAAVFTPHDVTLTGTEGLIYADDSENTWKGHNGTSFFRFMQQSTEIPDNGEVGVWNSTTGLYEPTTIPIAAELYTTTTNFQDDNTASDAGKAIRTLYGDSEGAFTVTQDPGGGGGAQLELSVYDNVAFERTYIIMNPAGITSLAPSYNMQSVQGEIFLQANGTASKATSIEIQDSSAIIVTATNAPNFAGIEYNANYANKFKALSLITKGYADSLANLKATIITETANRAAMMNGAGGILEFPLESTGGLVRQTQVTGFELARGTTAERPLASTAGRLRWNTTTTKPEISNGVDYDNLATEDYVQSAMVESVFIEEAVTSVTPVSTMTQVTLKVTSGAVANAEITLPTATLAHVGKTVRIWSMDTSGTYDCIINGTSTINNQGTSVSAITVAGNTSTEITCVRTNATTGVTWAVTNQY